MDKIAKLIENMVGKTYLYMGEQITINGYYIAKERVYFSTNIKLLAFNANSIEHDLKDFLQVEMTKTTRKQYPTGIIKHTKAQSDINTTDLVEVIKDNIKKLREDAGYVNQANAINKSINTLINLAKTELMFQK